MEKTARTWWSKLGEPQYGGEMTLRINTDITIFDPYFTGHHFQIYSAWLEQLYADDWTIDPAVYGFKTGFHPGQFIKGFLAESGEFTDANTYVVRLRKGIHWQDIPPLQGREFTADDVAHHYHRLYGLGSGFTQPVPAHTTDSMYKNLASVTAVDKYTVVFKWKTSNPEFVMETLVGNHGPPACIEAPEAVQKWGVLNDWHYAVGTGPFILHDFVPGKSASLVRNPNYWGRDERYPQNQLPYVDKLKILMIPDDAEAVAAMRAGKLDAIEGLSLEQAQAILKTNPEMVQFTRPRVSCDTLEPRNDTPPFNDIRVRKAMQMAIDLPALVRTYYGSTVDPYPQTLTTSAMKGWGFPYLEWPQELKDEYAYNPKAAAKLLADAGYPDGFKTNIVAEGTQNLVLLQMIKSYFAAVGINMEIRTMDSDAWVAFCRIGRKHDQIVNRHGAGALGLVSEPLNHLERFRPGFQANYAMVNDPVFNAFYTKALSVTGIDQFKQIVRDANEYVARQHFAVSLVQPDLFGLTQPWLKGYSGQFGAQTAHNELLSFYLARFWIDQELKKSLGH
jgi:peptide/nickel transport system substrate-binding protein